MKVMSNFNVEIFGYDNEVIRTVGYNVYLSFNNKETIKLIMDDKGFNIKNTPRTFIDIYLERGDIKPLKKIKLKNPPLKYLKQRLYKGQPFLVTGNYSSKLAGSHPFYNIGETAIFYKTYGSDQVRVISKINNELVVKSIPDFTFENMFSISALKLPDCKYTTLKSV